MTTARGMEQRMRRAPIARIAAALMFGTAMSAIAAIPAHAQESQASLRGQITRGGQPAAGTVAAIEVNTGIRRTATLAANGSYIFASLRPGTYRLEVSDGVTTQTTDEITLTVAQSAQLDFDLTETETATAVPGSDVVSGDEIIVTAGRVQELEGGEVGATISQRLIQTLPQNNRNFLAFADLAPGVLFQTGANGESRLQGGAQASRTVNVFIDGVGQKDYVLKNGVAGQDSTQGNPFPQLAIGEYRVISSNYKAEFDQVSSVAITAITRSGTNRFEGEGFIDFTNQDLRDYRPTEIFGNTATGEKVETQDMQFGGALAGPIITDVMHFFVSYEGKRQQQPVEIFPGDGDPISSIPAQYQDIFGTYNRDFNEDLYFGKIDISPTQRDLIEFTGKYRDESGVGINSGVAAYSTATDTKVDDLRVTGRWEHTADSWVNDFKVAYEDVSWSPQPQTFEPSREFRAYVPNAAGTGIRDYTLFRIGGGTNYQDKGQEGWLIQNDFTYTGLTGHVIKVGAKAKWVTLRTLQQNSLNPLYIYNVNLNGLDSFNEDVPYRLQFGASTGVGNSEVTSKNFQFGVYVQDDWDVTNRLTLNLGIRWDYERTPAYLDFVTPQDILTALSNYPNLNDANYDINDYISTGDNREAFTGAFQPRVGFSYKIDEQGTYVVFGGYGRSYDRNQFDYLQLESSVGSFATRTFNFTTTPADPNNPCTPSATCLPWDPVYLTEAGRQQLLARIPPGGAREITLMNNDLKMPYSDQFSLGLRADYNPLQLEVGYTHITSKDGFAFLLGNRRPDGSFFFDDPNSPTDTPNSPFGFAPPGFGSIILGTNGLVTRSDSAYLKVTKRYSESSPWSLDATYTFTEAEENRQYGEHYSLDFPSLEDYPTVRSSGVPRHRLVMAGSVDIPYDVTLSSRFELRSPTFNKYLFGSSNPFARYVYGNFAEGNGDRWGQRQLDLAAQKYFNLGFPTGETSIWARVDIINVMNDRNYTSFSAQTGKRNLNNYSTGGNPPRTIKLSAGFNF